MDKYIKLLASASKTQGHELIEECLSCYGVIGIRELTRQQLKDFCKIKGLLQSNNIIVEHNGYVAKLYGKSSMQICKDGNEIMHTGRRNVNTEKEVKVILDKMPKLLELLQEGKK